MAKEAIKFRNVGNLAAIFGADRDTFWDCFTSENFIDMIQLGWKPNKYTLNPAVVEYIEKVVMSRQPRKEVFPGLRDLN